MHKFRSDIHEGMTVYSIDDEKLGKIVRCHDGHFIIEKGIFFPKDYIARYEDVVNVAGDDLRLSVTKDALLRADEASLRGETETVRGATSEVRVPVTEEEIEVDKRTQRTGEVEIHKNVVTERKDISVPVMREEVHVERRPVNEPVRAGDPDAFREGRIAVPVREEEVEIHKRPVVREEVRVSKTPHVEQRHASETVRREEVDVDREGTARRGVRDRDDDLKKV